MNEMKTVAANDISAEDFMKPRCYDVGFDLAKESDITAYGYIELPHFRNPFYDNDKKISRKKFKKWLMSRGINRNLAERFCNVVKSCHGKQSYQILYFNGLFSSTSRDLVCILFVTLFPIDE